MWNTYMAMLSTKIWFYYRFKKARGTTDYAHVVTSVIVIQFNLSLKFIVESWYTEPIRSYAIIIITMTSVA